MCFPARCPLIRRLLVSNMYMLLHNIIIAPFFLFTTAEFYIIPALFYIEYAIACREPQ